MNGKFHPDNYKLKMQKTFESFRNDLSSLRTGRANPKMLDLVRVDVYGQKMPINQLGTISVPEPRLITIQVWDLNNVSLIDSAIKKSELDINPQIDGQLIRLPIPSLNEERRNELKKVIKTLAEKAKVSIRNIRRDMLEHIRSMERSSDLSKDVSKRAQSQLQNLTDLYINQIDTIRNNKEKEVMEV